MVIDERTELELIILYWTESYTEALNTIIPAALYIFKLFIIKISEIIYIKSVEQMQIYCSWEG